MSESSTAPTRLRWVHDLQFVARTPSGQGLLLDSGADQQGRGGTGPGPMELLPAALGGCSGMDVISILRKMKQPVEGLEIEIDGERAPEHPRRYTALRIVFHLTGTDLDAGRLERAIALSRDRYCSVAATLAPGLTMAFAYTVNGSEPRPVPADASA